VAEYDDDLDDGDSGAAAVMARLGWQRVNSPPPYTMRV